MMLARMVGNVRILCQLWIFGQMINLFIGRMYTGVVLRPRRSDIEIELVRGIDVMRCEKSFRV